ncbi:TPA: hypothetical protein NJ492_004505 [Vibrio parahaemolyticus]|nr:hypothetical protein [Vibrio parahaemolyticus]
MEKTLLYFQYNNVIESIKMYFEKSNFQRLLHECKNALAPFKISRPELAKILDRQHITDELVYELTELAKSEDILLTQTAADFLLVAKFYKCNLSRVYREEFSQQELNDNNSLAVLKSYRLLQEIDLDASIESDDNTINKLDYTIEAIDELIQRSIKSTLLLNWESIEESLLTYARHIRDEYNNFLTSNDLDSEDLSCDLDEIHHSTNSDFEYLIEEALLIAGSPSCSGDVEDLPKNEFYLAFLPISETLLEIISDIREEYFSESEFRKAKYSDSKGS